MQRSFLMFSESLKSEHTRKQYQYYLDKFKGFYHLRDYDSMITIEPQKLQIMIEDYILDLKKRVSPNTLPTMIFGIQAFFDANDIDLKWKKIQKLFPEKLKPSGSNAWTLPQIQKMLSNTTDHRTIALVLFLASSGVRIGAIPDMKIKHLRKMDLNCYGLTVYAGTKDEYFSFLTPEASEALDSYFDKRRQDGEYLGENSPVFRARYKLGIEKVKVASKSMLQEITRRLVHKARLRESKEGNRYDIQVDMGFRKFFNLTLKTTKEVNPNYAEKMLGHSSTIPLDNHYLPPSIEAYFEEYKKAIPNLTISEAKRSEFKILEQERKIDELTQKDTLILDLTQRLADVEKILKSDKN